LPHHFHAVLNTALITIPTAVEIISALTKDLITPEKDELGKNRLKELLSAQLLVNKLIFDHKLNVFFLRAVINKETVTIQGIADSAALAETTISLAATLMPGFKVESAISVVQDFKAYP
jgi:hypothetical protein